MSLLLGEGPIRRFIRRRRGERKLRGSPQERVKVAVRVKYGEVDGVKVTYVASGEITPEDWRRLVRERKEDEFIRKVVGELKEMGFVWV